jgi:hypothetical protein
MPTGERVALKIGITFMILVGIARILRSYANVVVLFAVTVVWTSADDCPREVKVFW